MIGEIALMTGLLIALRILLAITGWALMGLSIRWPWTSRVVRGHRTWCGHGDRRPRDIGLLRDAGPPQLAAIESGELPSELTVWTQQQSPAEPPP